MTFEEGAAALSVRSQAKGVTATEAEPAAESASMVVGLKREDGMTEADAAIRPRVSVLQTRLNTALRGGANAVDGKFGPKTGRELREFQASIRQPSQELVDPISAGALFDVAPPGSLPPVTDPTGVSEPDRAQQEKVGGALSALPHRLSMLTSSLTTAGASLALSSDFGLTGAGGSFVQAALQVGQSLGTAGDIGQLAAQLFVAETAKSHTIGNGLVGLQRGDGLVGGSFHRRGRVVELQRRLNAMNGAGLEEDGLFGKRTAAALSSFQMKHKLAQREIVDADVADLLMEQAPHAAPQGGALSQQMHQAAAHLLGVGTGLASAGALFSAAGSSMSLGNADLDPGRSAAAAQVQLVSGAYEDLASVFIDAANGLLGAVHGPTGLAARAAIRQMGANLVTLSNQWSAVPLALRNAGASLLLGRGFGDGQAAVELMNAGDAYESARQALGLGGESLNIVAPTGEVPSKSNKG